MDAPSDGGSLPRAFFAPGSSSFADFLASHQPDLLPGRRLDLPAGMTGHIDAPHGTTIVAVVHTQGVVMAGDRRATMGNVIAQRDIEKVFQADEYSGVGIAGTAGIAIELVRLFQVELEHYEKIEGTTLSPRGQGQPPVPADPQQPRDGHAGPRRRTPVRRLRPRRRRPGKAGRIFSYDVTGGRYEEHSFHSVGSGSVFARGALKKLYRDDFTGDDAVIACIQALYDAADDDSATGGPDLTRRIFPVVANITSDGFQRLSDDEVGAVTQRVVDERMTNPGGPLAPLRPAPHGGDAR